jgi:hypothetical protein
VADGELLPNSRNHGDGGTQPNHHIFALTIRKRLHFPSPAHSNVSFILPSIEPFHANYYQLSLFRSRASLPLKDPATKSSAVIPSGWNIRSEILGPLSPRDTNVVLNIDAYRCSGHGEGTEAVLISWVHHKHIDSVLNL